MLNTSCTDTRVVGNLVEHKVTFTGPVARHSGQLPERLQGTIKHEFINRSIYPMTFITTITTLPAALAVAETQTPSRLKVVVSRAVQGLIRTRPMTGTARQVLQHITGTGLGLPYTGTAEWATEVTPPWGRPYPRYPPPTLSITLTS